MTDWSERIDTVEAAPESSDDDFDADWEARVGSVEFASVSRPPVLDDVELFHGRFSRHVYPRHVHPHHYCLSIVLDGAIEFDQVSSHGVAEPGAILVVEPGQGHGGRCALGTPFRFRSAYFPASAFASFGMNAPRFPGGPLSDPHLFDLAREFHREIERNEENASPVLFRSIIERLLTHAISDEQRAVHPAVRTSLEFMQHETTVGDDTSLDILAARVGLHPVYLSRLFTRTTGLPPQAYRTSVRLQFAKERLTEGEDVADVAADLGFTDQSHLSRLFKRNFGITPAAYASRRLKTYKTAPQGELVKS